MAGKTQAGVERQMTFSSQLDARQFLINKITNQASRTATPLSDAERRMLQLNLDEPESATGIPVEVLNDTSGKYEAKITWLLQSAYKRDLGNRDEQQKYKDAMQALKNTDHYMLIIASAALPQRKQLSNVVVYLIIGLAVVAMILALQWWTRK